MGKRNVGKLLVYGVRSMQGLKKRMQCIFCTKFQRFKWSC
jgi:hypothetical protein